MRSGSAKNGESRAPAAPVAADRDDGVPIAMTVWGAIAGVLLCGGPSSTVERPCQVMSSRRRAWSYGCMTESRQKPIPDPAVQHSDKDDTSIVPDLTADPVESERTRTDAIDGTQDGGADER